MLLLTLPSLDFSPLLQMKAAEGVCAAALGFSLPLLAWNFFPMSQGKGSWNPRIHGSVTLKVQLLVWLLSRRKSPSLSYICLNNKQLGAWWEVTMEQRLRSGEEVCVLGCSGLEWSLFLRWDGQGRVLVWIKYCKTFTVLNTFQQIFLNKFVFFICFMFLYIIFTSFSGEHVCEAPHAVIPEVEFRDQFFKLLTMDHVSCYFCLLCERFIYLYFPSKQPQELASHPYSFLLSSESWSQTAHCTSCVPIYSLNYVQHSCVFSLLFRTNLQCRNGIPRWRHLPCFFIFLGTEKKGDPFDDIWANPVLLKQI